jgi:hypothetical protein
MFNGKTWQGRAAAIAAATLIPAAAHASVLVAVPPTADAQVRSFSERKIHGFETEMELRTGGLGGTAEGYFTFPLPQHTLFAEKIVFRFFGHLTDGTSMKMLVRSVPNAIWSEAELNWRTRPEHKETLGTLNVVGLSGAWYELDVTAYAQREAALGRKAICLALVAAEEKRKVTIPTREASSKKPELLFARAPIGVQISFCPTNAIVPDGFIGDHGDEFALRPSGFIFGWNSDNRAFMRNRAENKYKKDKPVQTIDRRYDYLAYMDNEKMKTSSFWEMAVPNGTYRVRIVAGDSTRYDSIFGITVENVVAIEGLPDTKKRWFDSTVTVNVVDGRLTIGNAPGSSNNKISFIEINEVENLISQNTPKTSTQ